LEQLAGLVEDKDTLPMVRAQMSLIQDVQTAEWWIDVTVPMPEQVRRRLRDLMQLIEKGQRKAIFTDFENQMGPESHITLSPFQSDAEFEKFRAKARAFLRAHLDTSRSTDFG
jgi:type I restriction enzyme R subunit